MRLILVDSSVWAEHFRTGDGLLEHCLRAKRVRMHPFVIGELAMGNLRQRGRTLTELNALHRVGSASDSEVLSLIETGGHYGAGLSWVDMHLLAAVLLREDVDLWTRDRRLNAAAARYGRAARLHH